MMPSVNEVVDQLTKGWMDVTLSRRYICTGENLKETRSKMMAYLWGTQFLEFYTDEQLQNELERRKDEARKVEVFCPACQNIGETYYMEGDKEIINVCGMCNGTRKIKAIKV